MTHPVRLLMEVRNFLDSMQRTYNRMGFTPMANVDNLLVRIDEVLWDHGLPYFKRVNHSTSESMTMALKHAIQAYPRCQKCNELLLKADDKCFTCSAKKNEASSAPFTGEN